MGWEWSGGRVKATDGLAECFGLLGGVEAGLRLQDADGGLHTVRESAGSEEETAGDPLLASRFGGTRKALQGQTQGCGQVIADLPQRPVPDRGVTDQEALDLGHHVVEAGEGQVAWFRH